MITEVPEEEFSFVSDNVPKRVLCLVGKLYAEVFPPRFLRQIRIDSVGCWIWLGATKFPPNYPQHKYGQYNANGNPRGGHSAHKFSYELVHGRVPRGLELDHTCEVKLCVNPDHLEVVTHQQNCARRKRSGPLPGYKLVNGKLVRA